MCMEFTGNKVHVTDVGNLAPGEKYRTPEGDTLMVCATPINEVITTVVNLRTGIIVTALSATKLGRDRAGRLYASRSLNQVAPNLVQVEGKLIDMNTEFNDLPGL